MSDEVKQIPVLILDKEYVIACQPDEEQELLSSARLVDNKMREIRSHGKVIGSERIAVMTSLNMAHDLIRAESGNKGYKGPSRTRLRALQKKIDSVLKDDNRQMRL